MCTWGLCLTLTSLWLIFVFFWKRTSFESKFNLAFWFLSKNGIMRINHSHRRSFVLTINNIATRSTPHIISLFFRIPKSPPISEYLFFHTSTQSTSPPHLKLLHYPLSRISPRTNSSSNPDPHFSRFQLYIENWNCMNAQLIDCLLFTEFPHFSLFSPNGFITYVLDIFPLQTWTKKCFIFH